MKTLGAGKARTNVYLDQGLKDKAKDIFHLYGMGLSEAFNIFLGQVVAERGIPFQIKIPNDETLKTMKDIVDGKNVEPFDLTELQKEFDVKKKKAGTA